MSESNRMCQSTSGDIVGAGPVIFLFDCLCQLGDRDPGAERQRYMVPALSADLDAIEHFSI